MEVCGANTSTTKLERALATPQQRAFGGELLGVNLVSSSDQRRNTLLHTRVKSELAAVHRLLAKVVGTLARGSPSPPRGKIADVPPRTEEPPAKRRMASCSPVPLVARVDASKIEKIVVVAKEDEYVDICGGVSPLAIAPQVMILSPKPSRNSSFDESINIPAAAEHHKSLVKLKPKKATTEGMITERKRKEEISRLREKAHQQLLEMESTTILSEHIDPSVLKEFGINQYVYSLPRPRKTTKGDQLELAFKKLQNHVKSDLAREDV